MCRHLPDMCVSNIGPAVGGKDSVRSRWNMASCQIGTPFE